MPRSKRSLILMENGIYHVFNRGICRKHIQFTQEHQEAFFVSLQKSSRQHEVKILAYCLMSNHYHLVVHTKQANLDKFMQYFSSLFARIVNHQIGADGALFRSRYNSLLVQDNNYVLQLVKYVHLNPVEAKIVRFASEYELSSYDDYMNEQKDPVWMDTSLIKSMFSTRAAFQDFHMTGVPKKIREFYDKKKLPPKFELDADRLIGT